MLRETAILLEQAADKVGVKLFAFPDADHVESVTPSALPSDRFYDSLVAGIDRGDGTYTLVEFDHNATKEQLVTALKAAK